MVDQYSFFNELNEDNLFLEAINPSIHEYSETILPRLTPSITD